MLGVLIGDIAGSCLHEGDKNFDLLTYRNKPTNISLSALAAADAILKSNYKLKESFSGYVSVMGVICAYSSKTLSEAFSLLKDLMMNYEIDSETIKCAEAVLAAAYMALHGSSILEIRDYINDNYFLMNFTLKSVTEENIKIDSEIKIVPLAIMAFLESTDFESSLKNAILLGGSFAGAISGGIAEAYYGIPVEIRKHSLTYLSKDMLNILNSFETKFGTFIEKTTGNVKRTVKYKMSDENKIEKSREDAIVKSEDITDAAIESSEITSEKTTSKKLFNFLYQCCNILRGPINQDEFKTYVIPLLFFKRMSDAYDEETQLAYEQYGDDVKDFEEDELHKFIIPEGYHWEDVRNASENIGSAIVSSMIEIERANPETMSGLFSSFDDANWTDKNKLSDERLKDLVEHMSQIKIGNNNYSADVMGDAYEYLLKKFADLSKKNAGEFYTPREIVQLLVKILAPKPGETVYDPACGTGGMLIESIRQMNDIKSSYGRIYGQEKNLATSAIARMNLYLHGALDFKVTQGDTLRSPNYLYRGQLKTFDCCIANPPFGLKKWGADQFSTDIFGRNIWGCPSDSSADFAWLQHIIKSMDPKTGRCTVILPQGVLFHGGKEGDIRKELIKSDKLEAVITFVGGLFYGAGVSACTLVLNNNKPAEHKEKVILIDGSEIYTAKRAQNELSEDNVNTLYKLYKDYKDVIDFAKVVTLKDIADKDYTLSVNSYIEKTPEAVIDPAVVKKQYFEAVEAVKAAEEKLKNLLVEGGLINE